MLIAVKNDMLLCTGLLAAYVVCFFYQWVVTQVTVTRCDTFVGLLSISHCSIVSYVSVA